MSNLISLNPTQLIQIYPSNLTISNFIPDKLYRHKVTLYNISSFNLVLTIKSSDKYKMTLNENIIRLNSNQSKQITLIIKDIIKYYNNRTPNQKRIFLIIKCDLFEEKYTIDLLYNQFTHKNVIISNLEEEYIKYGASFASSLEEKKEDIPLSIENSVNFEFIHLNNPKTEEIIKEKDNIIKNTTEDNVKMKAFINNMLSKVKELENILENYEDKLKEKRVFSSLSIEQSEEIKYKGSAITKKEDVIEEHSLKTQNELLKVENSVLSQRVMVLEEKLKQSLNLSCNPITNTDKSFNDLIKM